jgi:biofilm PGA synthesis N-glycosyltransferase PgaC
LDQVRIAQIMIVASGCTDRTEEIVQGYAQQHPHIRLLRQANREGKAAAINLCMGYLRHHEIIVLHSADLVPAPDAIENLVRPFEDPQVGMTGGRPVPTNDPKRFMGYTAHLLWGLHHRVSLRRPKMGEVIAFRNIFRQIPYDSAVDEASIEPLIRGQGMHLLYAQESVVYNHGPETVRDFLKQRRRIFAGHLYVKDSMGYSVSTIKMGGILPLFIKEIIQPSPAPQLLPEAQEKPISRWRHIFWGPAVAALEVYSRFLGNWDYTVWKRKPFVWSIAESTKDLAKAS